jgi:hypothetical protein
LPMMQLGPPAMTNRLGDKIGRRDVLLFTAGAVAAATSVTSCAPSAGVPENDKTGSKAGYQPNSPDVQNFYRVNRYPKK